MQDEESAKEWREQLAEAKTREQFLLGREAQLKAGDKREAAARRTAHHVEQKADQSAAGFWVRSLSQFGPVPTCCSCSLDGAFATATTQLPHCRTFT